MNNIKIHIPKVDKKVESKIVGLVDKVIEGKKNNEVTREWLGLLKIGIEFI